MAPKESQKTSSAEAAPGPATAERSIPEEARRLLHELAAAWEDVAGCGREPEVVPLKGAMTNEVYQARWATGVGEREDRKVLVRVYGEGVELFFDREDEVRTFECMSRHGHGPRLLGRFRNGRVEEFIHARRRCTIASGNMAKSSSFFFQMRTSTPQMPIDILRKLCKSSNFYFLINKPLNQFQRRGALLGGACKDRNFKDDHSVFYRYRHSRLRLLHINGEGAIQ